MTPVEPTKLSVYRGDNKEFESEGFYEVQASVRIKIKES